MTARRLQSFFEEAASPLQRLAQAANRLLSISRIWESVAPKDLARSCRVGHLKDGVLTLYVSNGAVASKIKYLAPKLVTQLQGRGCQVNGIQVEVQVTVPSLGTKKAPKQGVPAQGLDSLEKLEQELPESELKQAITNLITHQRSSKQQD